LNGFCWTLSSVVAHIIVCNADTKKQNRLIVYFWNVFCTQQCHITCTSFPARSENSIWNWTKMLRNFRDTMIVVGVFSHRISSIRLRNAITVKFSTRPRLLQYQLYTRYTVYYSRCAISKNNIRYRRKFSSAHTHADELPFYKLLWVIIIIIINTSTILSLYYFTLKHRDMWCGAHVMGRNVLSLLLLLLLRRF